MTGVQTCALPISGAPQTAAGSYLVTATVNDPNFVGSASGTFVITAPPPPVGDERKEDQKKPKDDKDKKGKKQGDR